MVFLFLAMLEKNAIRENRNMPTSALTVTLDTSPFAIVHNLVRSASTDGATEDLCQATVRRFVELSPAIWLWTLAPGLPQHAGGYYIRLGSKVSIHLVAQPGADRKHGDVLMESLQAARTGFQMSFGVELPVILWAPAEDGVEMNERFAKAFAERAAREGEAEDELFVALAP